MLSKELRTELDRRLEIIAEQQNSDPAFRDLPKGDHLWLLILLFLFCVSVPMLQFL